MIVGAPLAGIAGLLGFISTTMTVGGRRLNKKITTHEKTISLAEAKHLLISHNFLRLFCRFRTFRTCFELLRARHS